jgi:hypothetical protein
MRIQFTLWILLSAIPALAANNAVHDACKRLCETDGDCVHKCVGQAELFELRPDFVNAVADWTKNPEDRMRALRSGANLEILALCQQTGWSLDNKMICLRSYPTPQVIKNCKKLSPLQEEQVRCVRSGKTEAEIDACIRLVPGAGHRLDCIERRVSVEARHTCGEDGGDSFEKMGCLERAEKSAEAKARAQRLETRIRLERNRDRAPASLEVDD